jgi:signal transduction histidine kinase
VDEGVEQVRHIAHRLRPAALDGLGTRAALRAHAERWSRDSGLELVVTLPEVEPPGHVGEVLFRVAQEALTNVTRHAEARRVTVSLLPFDDGWRLVVEDDGKGIPAAPAEGRRGLGLLGARERVEQAGGYLDVEAAEPRGTRVLAWHP